MKNEEFKNFMWKLMRLIPAEQLPTDIVIHDDEYEECARNGNSWMTGGRTIHFHRRSNWDAEQKYKDRLAALEQRVRELEK